MSKFKIVVFKGDYCGAEVADEAVKVLRAIESVVSDISFKLDFQLLGGASIDTHGVPVTNAALDAAKLADAVFLGAIGGPKWSTSPVRPEQGLLQLRKELNAFGNLRPCFFASDALVAQSPLKESVARGTNFTIVRELTSGIYFGEHIEAHSDTTDTTLLNSQDTIAHDTMTYRRHEIERIGHLAAFLALQHNPPACVTSLDKANVLATSRLWRNTLTELFARDYPQVKLQHQLIDSAAMIMINKPTSFNGVIVTSNLFGDIISDEASVIPGSIGLLPSASLVEVPRSPSARVKGIYEPIHGSAPDLCGKSCVNPVAAILSLSMMFRYSLGLTGLANHLDDAVRYTLDRRIVTPDVLGGTATTCQVTDSVIERLTSLLKDEIKC